MPDLFRRQALRGTHFQQAGFFIDHADEAIVSAGHLQGFRQHDAENAIGLQRGVEFLADGRERSQFFHALAQLHVGQLIQARIRQGNAGLVGDGLQQVQIIFVEGEFVVQVLHGDHAQHPFAGNHGGAHPDHGLPRRGDGLHFNTQLGRFRDHVAMQQQRLALPAHIERQGILAAPLFGHLKQLPLFIQAAESDLVQRLIVVRDKHGARINHAIDLLV